MKLGKKNIGIGYGVYIVLEAGPTHTGLDSALELVSYAAKSGADAIKFQIADHNRLITTKDLMFSYDVLINKETGESETVTEPLIDIWERRFLTHDEWKKVKEACDNAALDFFATVFFVEDVDFLKEIGVTSFKIASQDVGHEDLIRYCAKTGFPLQIDTGSASIGEIERAVEWIKEENNENIIINHCPSGYPARLESIHLNMIKTLKTMFEYPIAFSDHTPGWDMDVAARSLGADIIEKTITLDRTIRGCEHIMSLEPTEINAFVQVMRDLDVALGNMRRVISPDIKKKREAVRRSGFLIKEVKKGQKVERDDFDFRRPGYGIFKPDTYNEHVGRTYNQDLPIGTMIKTEHLA